MGKDSYEERVYVSTPTTMDRVEEKPKPEQQHNKDCYAYETYGEGNPRESFDDFEIEDSPIEELQEHFGEIGVQEYDGFSDVYDILEKKSSGTFADVEYKGVGSLDGYYDEVLEKHYQTRESSVAQGIVKGLIETGTNTLKKPKGSQKIQCEFEDNPLDVEKGPGVYISPYEDGLIRESSAEGLEEDIGEIGAVEFESISDVYDDSGTLTSQFSTVSYKDDLIVNGYYDKLIEQYYSEDENREEPSSTAKLSIVSADYLNIPGIAGPAGAKKIFGSNIKSEYPDNPIGLESYYEEELSREVSGAKGLVKGSIQIGVLDMQSPCQLQNIQVEYGDNPLNLGGDVYISKYEEDLMINKPGLGVSSTSQVGQKYGKKKYKGAELQKEYDTEENPCSFISSRDSTRENPDAGAAQSKFQKTKVVKGAAAYTPKPVQPEAGYIQDFYQSPYSSDEKKRKIVELVELESNALIYTDEELLEEYYAQVGEGYSEDTRELGKDTKDESKKQDILSDKKFQKVKLSGQPPTTGAKPPSMKDVYKSPFTGEFIQSRKKRVLEIPKSNPSTRSSPDKQGVKKKKFKKLQVGTSLYDDFLMPKYLTNTLKDNEEEVKINQVK